MELYNLIYLEYNSMIPGFTTLYRDELDLAHLYFYPGVDTLGRSIYKLDFIDTKLSYKFIKYSDKAIEYTFLNKDISKIEYVLTNLVEHSVNKYVKII